MHEHSFPTRRSSDLPNLVVTQNNTGSENLKNLTVGDDVDVSFPDSAIYILPG
jgi:hypothetical protein